MKNFERYYDDILKSVKSRVGLGCAVTKVRKREEWEYCDHNCFKCNHDNVMWLNSEADEDLLLVSEIEYELLKEMSYRFNYLVFDECLKQFVGFKSKQFVTIQNNKAHWKTDRIQSACVLLRDDVFGFVRSDSKKSWDIAKLIAVYEQHQ